MKITGLSSSTAFHPNKLGHQTDGIFIASVNCQSKDQETVKIKSKLLRRLLKNLTAFLLLSVNFITKWS